MHAPIFDHYMNVNVTSFVLCCKGCKSTLVWGCCVYIYHPHPLVTCVFHWVFDMHAPIFGHYMNVTVASFVLCCKVCKSTLVWDRLCVLYGCFSQCAADDFRASLRSGHYLLDFADEVVIFKT